MGRIRIAGFFKKREPVYGQYLTEVVEELKEVKMVFGLRISLAQGSLNSKYLYNGKEYRMN